MTTIRALIVDDEAPARARLRHLLAGHDVDIVGEAAGGTEALERVADLSPDLLFLDIQMPGMSGLELAGRLAPPRPRIVFCTAFDEFAIQAFEHHAVDYLLKPVNRQRLANTLGRIAADIREQRLRARDEAEAVTTQARLMPARAPEDSPLDCAGLCVPARGISGDYFDILPLGRGRIGLTVGDVSGKGTYAGLLMAALQARIQATAARGVTSPAVLLRTVNALTQGTMEGHRFATVFFGLYEADESILRSSCAGHPPALLVSATDGLIRQLNGGGPAIGWPEAVPFQEDRVALLSRDVLVAYTDGVTEACNPCGEAFGLERLGAAVVRRLGAGAAEILEGVRRDLATFCEGLPAEDDRTLLVARVRG